MIEKKGFIGSVLTKTLEGYKSIGILKEIGGEVTLCKRINVKSIFVIPYHGEMHSTIGLDEYVMGDDEEAKVPRYSFNQILVQEWNGEQRCFLVDRKTFEEKSIKNIQPKTDKQTQMWFLPLIFWKEVTKEFEQG